MESIVFEELSCRNTSKLAFRSPMISEILSEARYHIPLNATPYLFTGEKIHRKYEESKEIAFVVKGGHLSMNIVKGLALFVMHVHF